MRALLLGQTYRCIFPFLLTWFAIILYAILSLTSYLCTPVNRERFVLYFLMTYRVMEMLATSSHIRNSLHKNPGCHIKPNQRPSLLSSVTTQTPRANYEHTFVLADDYVSWLADHINKLRSGAYSVSESGTPSDTYALQNLMKAQLIISVADEINVFPKAGMRGVGLAETRGIVIESSPLFIPEKCNLSLTPPSYFWAYRIHMAMDPSCTQPASKVLQTKSLDCSLPFLTDAKNCCS